MVSLVVFGSAVRGGFAAGSDVDLLLVLADGSPRAVGAGLQELVQQLEITHGFRPPADAGTGPLDKFLHQAGGNGLSCFVCTRSDLLSGDVTRILGLRGPAAVLVDRIVLPSILAPAVTAWGEELLDQVQLPPIRRVDVLKACFNFASLLLLTAAAYPLINQSTKHAMGALKRAVHSCYFCYQGKGTALDEEVAFFLDRLGNQRTLTELVDLRSSYRESFGFVLCSLPTLLQLHWRTAWDNDFPRKVM
nr:nucleotidyltransferase domain-containing protein [Hymenobacter translucens]